MLPLFDLMMQAQNGKAMEALARQFNIAQDQAAKAVAALMPAFSAGLKRKGSNPFDFAGLMQKAASGNYQSYFEDLARTFTPQGMADGNAALEQIFGSGDLARAVAEQAAKFTGLGQDVMRQMMPALADTMMGGLVKQMTGQMGQAASNPFSADSMLSMQRQWLESLGLQPRKADPMQSFFDNPFTQAMQGLFTPKSEAKAQESDPFAFNPFVKSFQDMMAQAMRSAAPAAEEPTEAKAETQPNPAEAYQAYVNSIFDSGLEVQKSYQASLDALFDQWKPKA